MRTALPNTSRPRQSVLHFVSTLERKTDTKWLVQLARYLHPEQFQLSVACFYGGGEMAAEFEALGVPTFNLNVRDERDPRAILRARRLIEQVGCDLVHTHLLRADLFGGAAARWAGVPAIVSTVYAMGDFRRAKKRKADRLLDAACAALPTRVIAVSSAVADDYVERTRSDPDRVTVIHTGIDPPAPVSADQRARARMELGCPDESPLIVTIARLSYEKGVDTLIDSAAILRQTNPQARIVVIGEGPDREALQKRINELDLAETAMLAGYRSDVWPILAAADVVCLPSKSEGMPNVLLEAMAMGRPIVAANVGGVSEAIEHEKNGLLVPANQPRALATSLRRCLNDPTKASIWGDMARRTVEKRFLAQDAASRYAALYWDVMGIRSGTSDVVANLN